MEYRRLSAYSMRSFTIVVLFLIQELNSILYLVAILLKIVWVLLREIASVHTYQRAGFYSLARRNNEKRTSDGFSKRLNKELLSLQAAKGHRY